MLGAATFKPSTPSTSLFIRSKSSLLCSSSIANRPPCSSMYTLCSCNPCQLSINASNSSLSLRAIFSPSVSSLVSPRVGVINPAAELNSFLSPPVASTILLNILAGTSNPGAAAATSATVLNFVFLLPIPEPTPPPGVLVPLAPPLPPCTFFFLSRLFFFSSSLLSSYSSPLSSAFRFCSCLYCAVRSLTLPTPAPCGRSFTSIGLTIPAPSAPRPWPSL